MPISNEVREAELVVYGSSCPNCGGFISDLRLASRLPCSSCLPVKPEAVSVESIGKLLRGAGRLREWSKLSRAERVFKELSYFFIRCVGNEPWSIQKLWMRRVAKGASFAILAPTGVGKTTFGLVVALYLARKGFKSYLIVPTTTLAMQLEKKIEEMSRKADLIVNYVVIHSKLKKKDKVAREKLLEEGGDFDILVTTSNYLLKNYEKILKHNFKFIFIDDVDAILRGSKAIDYILNMLGFTEEDIRKAMNLIRKKRELAYRGEAKELLNEINALSKSIERVRRKVNKILIVSSATGNPRGMRVRLFRELMGFEIGARPEFIRNIVDAYEIPENIEERLAELVKTLGGGGLIYVPIDRGIEYAEKLASFLKERGVNAEAMHSKKVSTIEAFSTGLIDVLVGVATYYGVLVRGLDLPDVIRYAIFVGVPRHKIGLRLKEVKAQDVLRLLPLLRDVSEGDTRRKLERAIARLRRFVRRAGALALERLNEVLEGKRRPETSGEVEFINAFNTVKELLTRPEVIEKLKEHPTISVVEEEGELFVLIPDSPTYIQASGRTSRLFLGGISKGLSVILVDDERLLKGLERRLSWLIEDFKFKPLGEVNLNILLKEIDRDRELIRELKSGVVPKELIKVAREGVFKLKTALLIVESPNKARTIARFFGRPSMREYGRLRVYEVNLGNYTLLITSSGGHVYELITELNEVQNVYGVAVRDAGPVKYVPVYTTIKRCLDCGHQFVQEVKVLKCPACGSTNIQDSAAVIDAIRDVALEVDEILIGTDPDTEGEKIAFDIANAVYPVNSNVRRIEFHEVTRKAIIRAISEPRGINYDLVRAQLVRRIEDRWIGFSLSKLLQEDFWRKLCRFVLEGERDRVVEFRITEEWWKNKLASLCREYRYSFRNLSAGRVQTPVLGWVIDAYNKWSTKKDYLFITLSNGVRVEVPLPPKVTKKNLEEVTLRINLAEESEEKLNPLPPYTTDAALSDISQKLGLSVAEAMRILQDLFEMGFITYHRTDSTRVSDTGINVAREYLKEAFGDKMSEYFTPRTWGTGGAHEAIRPTKPVDAQTLRNLINEGIIEPVRRLTRLHYSVYELIFQRFIASQSTPARLVKHKVRIEVIARLKDGEVLNLGAVDSEFYVKVLFDGYLKFYRNVVIREPIESGTYVLRADGFEVKKKPEGYLHNQSSLVRMMREREIGRPSTYAKIIDTLLKRVYVMEIPRETKKKTPKFLKPTDLGINVYEYLTKLYGELVSEERTRLLERLMLEVEEGKAQYPDLLEELKYELSKYKLV